MLYTDKTVVLASCKSQKIPIPNRNPLVLAPESPLVTAREFIKQYSTVTGLRTLQHRGDTFYEWTGTHYAAIQTEEIRSRLYLFLEEAVRKTDQGKIVPFDPTRSKVANVLQALAAAVQLPATVSAAAWLDATRHPPASDLIACANGLLHLPDRTLLPHTPAFFGRNALPFNYEPDAPEPVEWLKFLRSLWENDQESIDTLQQMFGWMLSGDTRRQKVFMLVGPPRSGKGTISRVLTGLLGQPNVCAPTLSGLEQNFGLEPLIGKRLAVISDARIGRKADDSVIVERLLSISGEDGMTIDRKFQAAWTGRLETRFMVLTNELPKLKDASGALAGRFIILVLRESFYGREDLGLSDRLLGELSGILNWSLAGLDCLKQTAHFKPPASAEAARRDFEDLSSPISVFLRERCVVDNASSVECGELFNAWRDWCHEHNLNQVGSTQSFGRDLRSVVPDLSVVQVRYHDGTGQRSRHFRGVGFKN